MSEASHVRPADPRAWITNLPRVVARQASVLRRLFDAVEDDQRIRAFRVRGSIARGSADEYSDLDTRIWVRDDHYEAVSAGLPALVRSIGSTVDILFETAGSPYLFVQFTDGIQLELSSGRVSEASDRDYGVVVLLDRDGMWDQPYEPGRPWDETLWLGWAWIALSDIDKYLRRGSLWEALTALEKARSLLLRHHAAEIGVRDPQYGVASILDYGGELPDGLESTVARLDAVEIRRAACACAALLSAYGRRPFVEFVLAQLLPC
jgi:predicted nucleotidyltransferase